ncbi:hypothetical protein Ciccas_002149 [Cichlidogyrus casuarinus]|uniref:C2H2-type domain-containing protein n=1 Tax=Cichlidogyrus casuarinus TaxID=1844966 RepID=A0ABD2QIM0_9PLAT
MNLISTPATPMSMTKVVNPTEDSNWTTTTTPVHNSSLFPCRWMDCQETFANIQQLSSHVYNLHYFQIKTSNLVQCCWRGCPDAMVFRNPLSLLSHLSDRHYSSSELDKLDTLPISRPISQTQFIQFSPAPVQSNSGTNGLIIKPCMPLAYSQSNSSVVSTVTSTKVESNSAEDVTVLRTKKTQEMQPTPFLIEDSAEQANREGPVTRHLRYTAALILRNLLTHCPVEAAARLKTHEPLLVEMAFSRCESAQVILHCLRLMAESSRSLTIPSI